MAEEKEIIISGGGIGGTAAALALSRKGRGVHLLEQSSEFAEIGAGIQLGPNIFRMFQVLGVTEAINDVAVFPDALIMNDALSGKEIMRVTLGDPIKKAFGFPYAVIYRPDVHNVLLKACTDSPLVRLSVNQKVTGFEDTGEGVRGITEAGDVHEGVALIGADGLWSNVREKLVGDGKPRVSGHIAYRAVLPIEEVPEGRRDETVILWAGPKTHLVTYPLHRGEEPGRGLSQ